MHGESAFRLRKRRERPTVRLFCLPFAGGTAAIYRLWHEDFPSNVEVCPLEYPGHGGRFGEPLVDSHEELVSSLHASIRDLLDVPVALFGHSMGAGFAFELAHRLGDQVVHLFASASEAPDYVEPDPFHGLDDASFLAKIAEMGGTNQAILQDPDLMALFLPVIRADLRMSETYAGEAGAHVTCPLTAFAGTRDETVDFEDVRGWSRFTKGPFQFVPIEGGHFFQETARPSVTGCMARALAELTTTSARPGAAVR